MTGEEAYERALRVARGRYQRALVTGDALLSGADLQGAAKKYSSSYTRSRNQLLDRLIGAGIHFAIAGRSGPPRYVVVRFIPFFYAIQAVRSGSSGDPVSRSLAALTTIVGPSQSLASRARTALE